MRLGRQVFWRSLGWAGAILVSASGAPAMAQAMLNTGPIAYGAPVTSLRDMPFRNVIRQQFDFSCGSAALATLLHGHYGRAVNESEVFRAMYAVGDQPKIRKVGFSLLDMKTYLASVGLGADGYRETPADLQAADAPAIAVVKIRAYRHFVVIKGVRQDRVLIGDPALGLKTYSIADFAKMWNGVVLRIHSTDAVGAYNRDQEWASLVRNPHAPMSDQTLSGFTRDLPPLYQITNFRPPVP